MHALGGILRTLSSLAVGVRCTGFTGERYQPQGDTEPTKLELRARTGIDGRDTTIENYDEVLPMAMAKFW